MIKGIIIALYCYCLISCIETPQSPEESKKWTGDGLLVLCEGVWGQDNSSLNAVDLQSGTAIRDIFMNSNQTALGDIATDILRFGDYVLISLTGSSAILKINLKTGKLAGKIQFGEEVAPRHIAIKNEHEAFVSDLYNNGLSVFNPTTMSLYRTRIITGPAPEEIVIAGDYLFVANSAYGDYLAEDSLAGTIAVVDLNSNRVFKHLRCGPNVLWLEADTVNMRLFAAYRHLPKHMDSLGGIVEYDINTLEELRHLRVKRDNLQIAMGQKLWFINDEGLNVLENGVPRLKIRRETEDEFWYSLNIIEDKGVIVVGNARNFTIDGRLLIFTLEENPQLLYEVETGINPTGYMIVKE